MSIIGAIIIGTTIGIIGTIAVTDIILITALPELLPARRPMSERSLFGCYLVFPTKDILLRRFPNPRRRRANLAASVQGVAVRWPAMQPWRVNLGFPFTLANTVCEVRQWAFGPMDEQRH
jgi:hypothetical protein